MPPAFGHEPPPPDARACDARACDARMQRPGIVPPAACPVQLRLCFDLSENRAAVVRAVLRERIAAPVGVKTIADKLGIGHRQVRNILRDAAAQLWPNENDTP